MATKSRKAELEKWAEHFITGLTEIRYGNADINRKFVSANKKEIVEKVLTLNDLEKQNCYFTLQRLDVRPKGFTSDIDISRYEWFPVDIDVKRPTRVKADGTEYEVPSSPQEIAEATKVANEVKNFLCDSGFPEPFVCSSGNGIHLLYRADFDKSGSAAVKMALYYLAEKFNRGVVEIDKSIHNPSRIIRVYGTKNRKGLESKAEGRLHREAKILSSPEDNLLGALTIGHLEDIIPQSEREVQSAKSSKATIHPSKVRNRRAKNSEFVFAAAKTGWEIDPPQDYEGGRKWIFAECPMDKTHIQNKGSTALIEVPDGRLFFKCSHDRCSDWKIDDVRDQLADEIDVTDRPDPRSADWRSSYFRSSEDSGKPRVFLRSVDPEEIAREVLYHLKNSGRIYRYGNQVVKMTTSPMGSIERTEMSLGEFGAEVALTCSSIQIKEVKGKPKLIRKDLSANVLYLIQAIGGSELPPLNAIITAPTFSSDGRLIYKPGYDKSAGFFYAPGEGFETMKVSTKPTKLEVLNAASSLMEPFKYFPWGDESSKVHYLCSILQQFLTEYINDPCPAYLFDATFPGSGKSLLAECSSIIGNGGCSMISEPKDKNELKKRLDAKVISGSRCLVLDNISSKLDDDDLQRDITGRWLEPRILGKSKIEKIKNTITWMITANRTKLCADMARRTIPIFLRPESERPSLAKLPDDADRELATTIMRKRADYVAMCLTILNGWMSAGAKKLPAYYGSFDRWAPIMAGILDFIDPKMAELFLGNTTEFLASVDDTTAFKSQIVEVLARAICDGEMDVRFKAGQAREILDKAEVLPWPVRDKSSAGVRGMNQAMGNWLAKNQGPSCGFFLSLAPKDTSERGNYYEIKGWEKAKTDENVLDDLFEANLPGLT